MTQIILRALALCLALIAGFAPAIAQQFPVVPDRTVIGRLGTGTSSGPSQAIPITTLLASSQVSTYVDTIADLKALTAGSVPYVYVGSYTTNGDGGEGWFYWNASSTTADNSGTIITPNSAPSAGRWYRFMGDTVSAGWFGVVCDGATNTTTAMQSWLSFASSSHARAVFPTVMAGKTCNVTGLTLISPSNFSIEGPESNSVTIAATLNNISTLAIIGQAYGAAPNSGGASYFSISNVKFTGAGYNGIPLLLQDALYWKMSNVTTLGGAIGATFLQGSEGDLYSHKSYGQPAFTMVGGLVDQVGVVTSGSPNVTGLNTQVLLVGMTVTGADIPANTHILTCGAISTAGTMCDAAGTIVLDKNATGSSSTEALTFWSANITSSGPINSSGGNFQNQNGGTTGPTIRIAGNQGASFFSGCFLSGYGTAASMVQIDGDQNSNVVGSVTFKECHSESVYNTTNTMEQFQIGSRYKAGTVNIEGGAYYGHGNGVNYSRDLVDIVSARSVNIRAPLATSLGATGFSRSVVRLESTFPASGDTYNFSGIVADGTGTMYSDANSVVTVSGNQSNGSSSFNGAIASAGTITPTALAADVNDYNPTGMSGASALRINGGAADRNITGIAGGADGRLLVIINIGSTNNLILKNESASSSAANRITVGLDITVGPNNSTLLRYDGTTARWRPWDSIVYSNVLSGLAGAVYAGAPAAFTRTPVLGVAGSVLGTIGLQNLTSGTITISPPTGALGTVTNTLQAASDTFVYRATTDTLTNKTISAASNTLTGTASSLTAGNATNIGITDDTTTNATMYPTWVTSNTGNLPAKVSSTSLQWNPASAQLRIGAGADAPATGGSSLYMTNNGNTSFVIRDSLNDTEGFYYAGTGVLYMGSITNHPAVIRSNNTDRITATAAGGVQIGATVATLAASELGMDKITASGSAPGAGTAKLAVVAGTTAGTCKLIMYAGTSTTATTVIDNVGGGC